MNVSVDEGRLRELHRGEMVTLGYNPDGEFQKQHAEKVVARATSALKGQDEMPYKHSHYHLEAGVCTECDAASLIAQYRDDYE